MNASRIKGEGGRRVRIGLSAVVVFAGFPVPATKDLISNNGQYKQQERTILILPPHAMPFPCPCLPLSLSQQGATDKVGKWSLDSAEWRGRERASGVGMKHGSSLGNGGMAEREGRGGRPKLHQRRAASLSTFEG